jgi:hypothetical protein
MPNLQFIYYFEGSTFKDSFSNFLKKQNQNNTL